jgi:hypothetical protein
MNTIMRTGRSALRVAAGAAALASSTAAPLSAQNQQCAVVIGAVTKLFEAPFHMYMVDTAGTDAGLHHGKPTVSEEIFSGGNVYVLVEQKWVKSPVDGAEMRKDQIDNVAAAKTTCKHLRDESVNGEGASVWAIHSETADGDTDSNAWISKSHGIVLRTETRIDVGGPFGKSHMVSNYSYANVQAPAGVK